jgi:RimJ/RimL family protein N-acetyltransferase
MFCFGLIFLFLAALRPEFHGKGLASAAVAVKMHEWAVGQMGATELRAQCFVSNVASVKLWQKHGFVEDPALRGEITVSEAKGGGVEPDMTLIWRK